MNGFKYEHKSLPYPAFIELVHVNTNWQDCLCGVHAVLCGIGNATGYPSAPCWLNVTALMWHYYVHSDWGKMEGKVISNSVLSLPVIVLEYESVLHLMQSIGNSCGLSVLLWYIQFNYLNSKSVFLVNYVIAYIPLLSFRTFHANYCWFSNTKYI